MCGIVGAVSERNITPILVEGLNRLEYRGYDSAGVAVFTQAGELQRRRRVGKVAELERAPEHIHTYRITPLALWNARAAGFDAEQAVDVLERYSRFPVPQALLVDVAETMARYGRLKLVKHPAHGLILEADDAAILTEVTRSKKIQPLIAKPIDDTTAPVHPSARGQIKQELTKLGWPVEDLAGYVDGESHPIELNHDGWQLRDYQEMAADSFWAGGSGVVVLPCGAGKTLVGAASMAKASATTLIQLYLVGVFASFVVGQLGMGMTAEQQHDGG